MFFCFFSHLQHQQKGISSIDSIDEKVMLDAIIEKDGVRIINYSMSQHIAAVIRSCIPKSPTIFKKILSYIPKLPHVRKNIQYLTQEEISKIKQVLISEESNLSLQWLCALYRWMCVCV